MMHKFFKPTTYSFLSLSLFLLFACENNSTDLGGATASKTVFIDQRSSSSSSVIYGQMSSSTPISSSFTASSSSVQYFKAVATGKIVNPGEVAYNSETPDATSSVCIGANTAQKNALAQNQICVSYGAPYLSQFTQIDSVVALLNKIDVSNSSLLRPQFSADSTKNTAILMLQMAFSNSLTKTSPVQIELGSAHFLLPNNTVFPSKFILVGADPELTVFRAEKNSSTPTIFMTIKDSVQIKNVTLIGSNISLILDPSAKILWQNVDLLGSINTLSGNSNQLYWENGKSQGWNFNLKYSALDLRSLEHLYNKKTLPIWTIDSTTMSVRNLMNLNPNSPKSAFLLATNKSSIVLNQSEINDSIRVNSSTFESRNSILWSKINSTSSTLKCYNSNDSIGVLNVNCGHP
jgi:hypothetical protein